MQSRSGFTTQFQAGFLSTTIVSLALCFSAHAQSNPDRAATPPAKSTPTASVTNDAQIYHNSTFAFRYQIPYGWVDRTKEMQSENQAGKSEVLLAAFERPPEAIGETINSAIVFASESAATYPGLKKAEDYLVPLTELTAANGFKADGEPYSLEVESRQLVRADFIKIIGTKTSATNSVRSDDKQDAADKNSADKNTDTKNSELTMRQCTLVLLTKGQIVSFTFIAGSEDELDDLMDSLHFVMLKPSTNKRP